MAVVLKSDNISMSIPKVIETKNTMVFYGQSYNKNNLLPIALEQLLITGTKLGLNTNKRLKPMALANCSEVWNEDTIIADEYEAHIFYSIIYNGANMYMIKYREIQNKIELLASTNLAVYYDKYLGQDENYLYYAFRTSKANSGSVYFGGAGQFGPPKIALSQIVKINKQDLIWTQLYEHLYCSNFDNRNSICIPTCVKIIENENYIYYAVYINLVSRGSRDYNLVASNFNIYRIVKSNCSIQSIRTNITVNTASIHNFFDNKDIFKISDDTIAFYLTVLTNTVNPLKLIKINLNETIVANIVTVENVSFTWNEEIKKSITLFPDGVWYSYETFLTKSNNKNFINIIMYQNANQAVAAQVNNQGIYTFEIVDYNNLKLSSYNRISGSVLKGYLLSKDRSFIIVSAVNETIFMKFNFELGCYEITNKMESTPYFIGLDLSERVWTIKSDSEVDIFPLSDVTDFKMNFEKDYYDYTGTDIETFIAIEAKNFLGECVSAEVELTIDGNAKFKENGLANIKVVTPSDGALNVPVIITGSNQIAVYPKISSSV